MSAALPRDPIASVQANWEKSGWGEVSEPMATVTSIVRANQILTGRAEALLRPFDLTFARYEMLMVLRFARRPMAMSKASRVLQVHPTSVTAAAERLERDGLITKTPSPDDARTVLLAITEAGRELSEETTQILNRELFAQTGFTQREITTLNRILRKFRQKNGDFAEPLG